MENVERLFDWGVIDARAVVEGDLRLVSASRRNRNLRVERRHDTSYLIKQPEPGFGGRETLAAEAGFYELCRRHPAAAPVVPWMARLHAFFPDEVVLVLEIVEGSRSLWQELRAAGAPELSLAPARALGQALAILHSTFRGSDLRGEPALAALGSGSPWSLRIHRPRPGALRRLSPAKRKLLGIVQGEPAVGEGLDAAVASWRVETVIHGDVRSDNVLALPAADEIRLIDWELVQRGDPAWDVGGAFQDLVLFWLSELPQAPDLEPEARVREAAYPLASVQAVLVALWQEYVTAAGLDPGSASELRRRVVRYSGARLIQAAWEQSREAERLTSLAVLSLQVAANLLKDPEGAAIHLLGLPPESAARD